MAQCIQINISLDIKINIVLLHKVRVNVGSINVVHQSLLSTNPMVDLVVSD